jgi:hypothetical protein
VDLILEHPLCSYWLQVIDDVGEFQAPPFEHVPYPCLLWDTRGGRSLGELAQLSTALVASNVRYVVAGGADCERWHHAVDAAFLDLNLEGEEYDARFVMTSSHTNESEDDVVFFLTGTHFDYHDFRRFLVLQLGADAPTQQRLREAVCRHAVPSDDDEPEESWSEGAV